MIPSAGGQYHWASILAPKSSTRFFSHVTGSICIVAWTAVPTGAIYAAGSIFQNCFAMTHPSYEPKGWHVTLIMWALLLICTVLNTWLGMILPVLEVFIGIAHVLGFFAVLIPIIYLGPRADARSVFIQTYNLGGWRDVTLATLVGLKGTVAVFLGTDGVVHMAEEVANSSVVVPHSMLFAIAINGILGFAMLIAFLFTAGDFTAILKSQATFPFMHILEDSTKSKGASIVLSSMIAIMQACAGLGGISSGSRMLWAFSRERALPGWRWIHKLDRRTTVPFHSIYTLWQTQSLFPLSLSSSVKSPTMAATDFEVREITTKDEFARLNDVLWTANFHPYELSGPFDDIYNKHPDDYPHPSSRPAFIIFHAVNGHTAEDRAKDKATDTDLQWNKHEQTPGSHYIYAIEKSTGRVVGGCEWIFYHSNPFPDGPAPVPCTWYPAGSERAEYASHVATQFLRPRQNWFQRPHAGVLFADGDHGSNKS
ncbi:hypothetical protein VN97_g6093 [Penicillium thymicola]|uniref:Uncharacterized protein n=1 Tax=Penicillium thymicola TaxID=293382 RepID=A0AAI9THL1_PENTH|nr:hypothetical protein VN97_g6093 [Penicillium thymicola]